MCHASPKYSPFRSALVAAVLAIALAACSAKLVGAYDETVDSGLTQTHTKTITFINKMESATAAKDAATGAYAANSAFYDEAMADLDTLALRLSAPEDARMAAIVGEIKAQYPRMRQSHQNSGEKFFTADTAKVWRDSFNSNYGIAVRTMTTRKRASSKGEG